MYLPLMQLVVCNVTSNWGYQINGAAWKNEDKEENFKTQLQLLKHFIYFYVYTLLYTMGRLITGSDSHNFLR